MNHVEVLRAMRQDGCCVDDAEWIAAVDAAIADMVRLDWLADRENEIGNVQLPTECVTRNLHSLRAAIDDAMNLPLRPNA